LIGSGALGAARCHFLSQFHLWPQLLRRLSPVELGRGSDGAIRNRQGSNADADAAMTGCTVLLGSVGRSGGIRCRKIVLALALVCTPALCSAESILADALARRIDAWLSEARQKLPYAIADTVIIVAAQRYEHVVFFNVVTTNPDRSPAAHQALAQTIAQEACSLSPTLYDYGYTAEFSITDDQGEGVDHFVFRKNNCRGN
jgi:hypothetical protein